MAENAETSDRRAERAAGSEFPAAGAPDETLRRVLAALASTYLRHGYWDQAIDLMEAAPVVGAENAAAHGLLAYAYLQAGQPARCLESIKQFFALNPAGELLGAAHLIRARAVRALAEPAALPAFGDARGGTDTSPESRPGPRSPDPRSVVPRSSRIVTGHQRSDGE
jgi:tetratricopeptide (TPR) repeat protein